MARFLCVFLVFCGAVWAQESTVPVTSTEMPTILQNSSSSMVPLTTTTMAPTRVPTKPGTVSTLPPLNHNTIKAEKQMETENGNNAPSGMEKLTNSTANNKKSMKSGAPTARNSGAYIIGLATVLSYYFCAI